MVFFKLLLFFVFKFSYSVFNSLSFYASSGLIVLKKKGQERWKPAVPGNKFSSREIFAPGPRSNRRPST